MDDSCDRLASDGAQDPAPPSTASPEEGADGDIELIRWCLSLTPAQRLDVLQDFVDTFWTPRHG